MVPEASPAPTEPTDRHHSLDGLRAAMMFLGIVIHAVLPYLPDPQSKLPYGDAKAASPGYFLVLSFIHSFRMPIFFVMAGFFAGLLRARRGTAGLLANRARRILIPFAVGWLIIFPLLAGTGAFFKAGADREGLARAWGDLISGKLYSDPNLTHLWFLYYLLFFYPLGLAVAWLVKRPGPRFGERIGRAFDGAMRSAFRPILFAIPTAITLWPMESGTFDTVISFRPSIALLVAYGYFFGFGWLLYGHSELLASFSRHAWKQVGLALPIWMVNVFASYQYLLGSPPRLPSMHLLAVTTGALVAWLFAFGITGLFVRFLNRPSPAVRYLTDASYWCYLAHLPLVFWLAALLTPLPVPSPIKVGLIIVLATAMLLVAYHVAVRPTFIGECLNGRRYPRSRPRPAPGLEAPPA